MGLHGMLPPASPLTERQAEGLAPLPPTDLGCLVLHRSLLANPRAITNWPHVRFATRVQLPGAGREPRSCGNAAIPHAAPGPCSPHAAARAAAGAGDLGLRRRGLSEPARSRTPCYPPSSPQVICCGEAAAGAAEALSQQPKCRPCRCAGEQETTATCWLPVLFLC